MSTSILDKISKVLAKAESTDNEHEADAFLAQAQRMATAHSIDLAVARRHVAKSQKRETPVQRTITIGAPRALGNAKMVALFLTVARNNDVTCNIASNSTYVVAYGFPSENDFRPNGDEGRRVAPRAWLGERRFHPPRARVDGEPGRPMASANSRRGEAGGVQVKGRHGTPCDRSGRRRG